MNKIAILSAVNIKHMSLISLYTSILESNGISYDIIYMDKYDEVEEIGADRVFRYVNIINHDWSTVKKILRHFRFYSYAKRVLESEKYDRIIVWNDVAITMFGLYLSRKWKGKYCLNIRDYNGEEKRFIYYIFSRAIENSAFTTISSEGFKSFLPPKEYVSLYSYNSSLLSEVTPKTNRRTENEVIKISFIGNVRFFDKNKKLIDIFKNDSRFVLCFHGTNADVLEEYAKNAEAGNVECSGSFPINQTKHYLEEADIINNVFGNQSIGSKTLTSIRLFHAAYMQIPILVSGNTYMEKIVKKYNIGFVIDENDHNAPNELYEWYHSYDKELFKTGCRELLAEAEKANSIFEAKVNEFIMH